MKKNTFIQKIGAFLLGLIGVILVVILASILRIVLNISSGSDMDSIYSIVELILAGLTEIKLYKYYTKKWAKEVILTTQNK